MPNTIIALRGQPNSGKTTVIMRAHSALKYAGLRLYSNNRSNAAELKDVLLIDGVRIGFVSSGDTPDRLQRSLDDMLAKGCRVIVCAARLNRSGEAVHDTIDVVERFARDNEFQIHWMKKTRHRETEDHQVAETILQRIREAIVEASNPDPVPV